MDITEQESAALDGLNTVQYTLTDPKPHGFFSDTNDTSCTVKVAVRVRPMVGKELREGNHKTCIVTTPELAKLQIGTKEFLFDSVFDSNCQQEDIFDVCAYNLVLGCFSGYNATILAYGQTGSGKTHTMGTGSTVGLSSEQIGIVPRVFDFIFEELENRRRQSEFSQFEVKVQFLELYGDDLHDLLDQTQIDKATGQSSKQLQIREEKSGAITIQGLKGEIVTSKQECINLLNRGISQRVTSSTLMNEGSSRSHAIFTVTINQKIILQQPSEGEEPVTQEENISAKFHFVDLAGSERIKKTGAVGKQMQEGISINKGLLALGNVIAALTDEKKIAAGNQFIPYRDSKLTRILQDSLGGNSRTTMIACASPSDSNMDESLSTIKYASRARNIKNKPKVNRDANSMLIEALRAQILQLQSENNQYQDLLKQNQIPIPENFIKEVDVTKPPQPSQIQNQQLQQQTNTPAQNATQTQELRDLKIKLARKEKELKELLETNTQTANKNQQGKKEFDDLQQERDDLIMRQETINEYLKQNNIALPKDLTQTKQNPQGGQRTQSLVDEYKAKLSKFQAEVAAKTSEIQQKAKLINDLQAAKKRDEAVLKKAIEENERYKREGKKSIPAVSQPVQPDPVIPDVEDIKSKFMDRLASKLENMFDQAPTQQERDQTQEVLQQTQNTTLDEREKLLSAVKQNVDQMKQDIGELLENTWASRIQEIKSAMKAAESDRKSKTVGAGADSKAAQQVEKEYRMKMDDLNKQLDSQQREKQRKEESIQKQMFLQETRIKSLETELAKERKEKEELENQKKYGEQRFSKFKSSAQKEVQNTKKVAQEKDKTVIKLKQDLKKTESAVAQKIQELKAIQKRALDEKIKREAEEQQDLDNKGIDIGSIKDWIKLNTEALMNQQELTKYLKDQRKARDELEDEMLQEGDRLTELMMQKERLELEREQLVEEGSQDEARLLEIDAELEDVVLESDSITQTLDTLDEHSIYINNKIKQLSDQITSFDPDSIKPPMFKGLNSVEMARATLRTFFMVLLDLNVYKRDLETKCLEQDETIIDLQSTVTVLQEKAGYSNAQREVMMQKQRMMSQLVGNLGDRVEFIDNREIADMGLSKDEQNQLTKMSLSKIVGNLRSKLQDEEKRNQNLSLKIEQLIKEKEMQKTKLTQIKREQKMAAPIKSQPLSKPKVKYQDLNADFDFNQRRSEHRTQESQGEEATIQQAPRRLSFKQRRDLKKEQHSEQDHSANEQIMQNIDSLTRKSQRSGPKTSAAPISSLKDRRNQKRERSQDDNDSEINSKVNKELEMLQKDVSNYKVQNNDARRKSRKRLMQLHKEVVEEVDDSMEESSSDSSENDSQEQLVEEDKIQEEDLMAKLDRAERQLQDQGDTVSSVTKDSRATEVTMDYSEEVEKKPMKIKWLLQRIVEKELKDGQKIVDSDSCGDRMFIMISDATLFEVSIHESRIIKQQNLRLIENVNIDAEDQVVAFAVFKDLNMIAFSVRSTVFLIDFENDLKFVTTLQVPNVSFIAIVDLYIVMMVTSDDDCSEATISCRLLYGGGEEGTINIKRFMEQPVIVRPGTNSVIFSCGNQIGRVSVPEMQLMFQTDSEHNGAILDFTISETCIFTTGEDLSIRVFDVENGMMLIAPMEDMECDRLAKEEDLILARCGMGQAILVLKYTDGAEELEEVDFIDLQSAE